MAIIRSLLPADLPAVVTLTDDAARRALVGRPLWETEAEAAAEVGAPGRRAFFVAEDEESAAIAGVAGYRLLPDGEAELFGPLVAVESGGVGSWLERRVTALAAQEGAVGFSMLIGLGNKSGQAWAEWRGYVHDSEAPELLLTWLYPGELRPVAAGGGLVRPAAPGDRGRLEWLVAESFPGRRVRPEQWLADAWVLELEGEVAGCMRFCRATGWIDCVCVDPALRRRGLGARLLTEAARMAAPGKVGLAVPIDDAAAVSLVRRLGFRREVPVARWMKR
ncbi:MAG TPA: GNAT family N-acetyltransferase [Symbiobacteriaceae bacterium]|nr:GNAT family N-acetyltransferase [Symbiobacteriaceae bacterium]